MIFNLISIDEFIANTIKNNPSLKAADLRKDLIEFKIRKSRGEKCFCGNPLWIIGSAITRKGCFTCITGESNCSDDYEIE